MKKTVITFGTYDLFHIGHLNILRRAAALGDELIVGVSTDELNFQKKGVYPTYNQTDRMGIVEAIRYVDGVFLEESLEYKVDYVLKYSAHVLVMGDDWQDEFDWVGRQTGCEVVYLLRTPNVSTTLIKENIRV